MRRSGIGQATAGEEAKEGEGEREKRKKRKRISPAGLAYTRFHHSVIVGYQREDNQRGRAVRTKRERKRGVQLGLSFLYCID